MCGIAGFLAVRGTQEEFDSAAHAMASAVRHRGPDGEGIWVEHPAGICLCHRRLAVLDLSPTGDQPMSSHTDRFVITFNGEIYNHPELRGELAAEGHRFRGTSDTEVVLSAAEQWGLERTLPKLRGMFAFAMWDRQTATLSLVRDRLGEKPLYYGMVGRALVFGSELKALAAHPNWRGEIDRDVLSLFFRFGYVPAPYSIYRGIRKLPQGTVLQFGLGEVSSSSLPEPRQYWTLRDVVLRGLQKPFSGDHMEATDELERLLGLAVREQMVADVPVGAFLSGGIDSSTIVSLMQKASPRPIQTFTIGFDDVAFDERPFAKAVSDHLGTDHVDVRLSARKAADIIPELPHYYDEPFADSSQISACLVAQLAKKAVTVSLSGDGGDELFCGYNRQVKLKDLWSVLRWIPRPARKALGAAVSATPASWSEGFLRRRRAGMLADQVQKLGAIAGCRNPEDAYLELASLWDNPAALVLGSQEPTTLMTEERAGLAAGEFVTTILYLESMTSLPDDMLVKLDRAGMRVALETRVPYLDQRVVEFAWTLPMSYKIRGGVGKWILRQVLNRHVPEEMFRRPKWGFGVPIDEWLKGPLREWAESLLDPRRLRDDGFLDVAAVRTLWTEHLSGRRKWQARLWTVLMFNAWQQHSHRRPASSNDFAAC
jgi:asparagine synthase (glutamine-hydrolysing)